MAVVCHQERIVISTKSGQVPLVAWCALAVAVFAALVFWLDPQRLLTSLGDTDDATRLLQVRALLDGASWYDMTLPRYGGAEPLISHWSRLIDAPIAVLLYGFELVLPQDQAELAVRAVWPLLVLLAFVYLMAREAKLRGGRRAALLTVVLTVTCLVGIVQFMPGRIDHHNAIIVGAVIGILRLARSFGDEAAAWSAGVFLGLGTAIGYEALALTTASLAAAVLFGLAPGRSLLAPSRAAVTFAATLSVALSVTKMGDALFVSACDALSINLVALAATAAIGVSVVQALEDRMSLFAKLAALALSGSVGLAIYASADPACLAGPFGQVDPALYSVWLAGVSETQSMLSLGGKLPFLVGMALVYLAVGFYCGARLMQTDRRDGLRFHMLMLVLSLPLSFWMIKLLPYATFLPVPLLALFLAQSPGDAHRGKPIRRQGAIAAMAVFAFAGGASWLLLTLSEPSSKQLKSTLAPSQNCRATASLLPLGQLPPALAVADLNLGPYIVANSDLDVLAAPYHRLDRQILKANAILNSSPREAEKLLRSTGARYVIICDPLDSTPSRFDVPADALQTLLKEGRPPGFLTRVPLAGDTPLKVFQISQ
jgi:hypothetical protein